MAEELKDLVGNVMNESENVLNRALDNPYINTAIKVFLGLYAAFAAPQLPKSLANLMDHTLVRIAFAFVIVFMATRDPSIAILIAVAFIVTLQTANKFRLYDTSLSVAAPGETSWLPSVSGNAVNNSVQEEQNNQEVQGNQQNSDGGELPSEPVYEDQSRDAEMNSRNQRPSDNLNVVVEGLVGTTPQNVENAAPVPQEESNQMAVFTNDSQFNDAQTNNVPGANQNSCVQSFNNQHCIQGLQNNAPNGLSNGGYSNF